MMTACLILNGPDKIGCAKDPLGGYPQPWPQQAGGPALGPRWDRLNDARLIAGCKAGHRPAWDALLNRYQGYIYRYVFSLCHNQADAEDITAQTLFRIYERLDTFREDSSFAAWITR